MSFEEAENLKGEFYEQVPFQFKKLFDLLRHYSEKYCTGTEIVFQKFCREWNPSLSRFEIETFFLSLLSFSICELKQDMDVIRGVQSYFTESLIEEFGPKEALDYIIANRVQSYCKLEHDCINDKENRNIEMEMLDRLLYHIEGVSVKGKIDESYPVVIQDFFQETLIFQYLHQIEDTLLLRRMGLLQKECLPFSFYSYPY